MWPIVTVLHLSMMGFTYRYLLVFIFLSLIDFLIYYIKSNFDENKNIRIDVKSPTLLAANAGEVLFLTWTFMSPSTRQTNHDRPPPLLM